MHIVVLDSATLGRDLDLSPLHRAASALGGRCTVYETSTSDEVKERIRDADAVVLNKVHVTRELLSYAKRLRLVCITATGYDNIDVRACKARGIAVCNVRGYSTDSVAQITVAMALSLISRLPEYNEAVRDGRYTEAYVANLLSPVYQEISGKIWGIVGLGNIGKRVAAVAEALGCRVLAYKRSPDPDYTCTDLETILRESDIISLHTPLTTETRGLIGKNELALIKKGSILINMARGAVTDEAAVADAMRSGHLGGLGVDVYSEEPLPSTHPLYAVRHLPNVCLTPHMAWGAKEARDRCLSEIILNIQSFASGGTRNRVDL